MKFKIGLALMLISIIRVIAFMFFICKELGFLVVFVTMFLIGRFLTEDNEGE